MTNKKLTKREKFEMLTAIPAVAENEMLMEFIAHEIELLAKKNSAEKKPTAQQVANDGVKQAILDGMQTDRLYSITELIKEIPECNDLTNQRVSALVRQLMPDHIERVEDKRKAYFRKIAE